jgi:DNA repair protein RadD
MEIDNWNWAVHTSKASGKKMLKVTYYGALSDPVVTEYFTVLHDGYAGTRAAIAVREIADESGAALRQNPTLDEAAEVLTDASPPLSIHYRKDGKFYRVLRRVW